MGLVTNTGQEVELELYKFDTCPYCIRVMDAIAELGIEVPMRDTLRDRAAARKLYEVGGKEQVPCLFIDGRPLYESADIVRWLREHFG